jgi:phosphoenolpyruvate carboxykinase (ATP)
MKLKITRSIIDAIHQGTLKDVPTVPDPTFGMAVPIACPNVDSHILTPRNTWSDPNAYDQTALKLAELFRNNFQKYIEGTSPEVRQAGPN